MRPRLHRDRGPQVLIAVMVALFPVAALLFLLGLDSRPVDRGGEVITGAPADTSAAITVTRRPPADSFGSGIHEVLAEVMAGAYRTEGPILNDWPICSWRLHKGGHILSSGTATGPTTIVLDPVIERVESSNCKTWRRLP